MNQIEEQDIIVKAPDVQPWAPLHLYRCPACGNAGPSKWQRFRGAIFSMGRPCGCVVGFCEGGKPPPEDMPRSIITEMTGQRERRNDCGGIERPHLHLKCVVCDYVVLMGTYSKL